MGNFLDSSGLSRVWGKIKAGFVSGLSVDGDTLKYTTGSGGGG